MSEGMKKGLRGLLFCFIVAVTLNACSESITNPLTPGSGLSQKDVIIRDTMLFAVSDTSYLQRIALDGLLLSPVRQNLIGKTGNYVAYTAIRFYPPARDTIRIVSAKLTLRLISWRGDSSGRFGFTAHKILTSWGQTTATWDTLSPSSFIDANSIVSYPPSGTVSVGADTQEISINLDTALVRSWYASTNNTNYGILLKPLDACSLIRGIHAFDFDSTKYWPKLDVIAVNNAGTVYDTTTFQSTTSGTGAGSDTYAANVATVSLPANRLSSQAGIVYRSIMRFDVSRLPAGAIITSATLNLDRDPALSSTNKFSISALPIVHAGVSSDSTKFESYSSTGTVKDGTSNTFVFDVRRQVQLWENGSNFGLILRQVDANELGTLDMFSFFSREATDPALRPRIAVKYTTFN